VDGLGHVNYLKSINDARLIRSKVIENFEQACLPTTTDEERKRLLSFVVCGGGPTGVEVRRESDSWEKLALTGRREVCRRAIRYAQ
jgi:NADH dehydrogenase